jgi:VWFA-related protein
MGLVLASNCLAQTIATGTDVNPIPSHELTDGAFTLSRMVNEVNLVFSVTDARGHLRSDLKAEDFLLLDNHNPPEGIRYFQKRSNLPLRVGVLIDNSSSIAHRIQFEKKGAGVFLKRILRAGVDQAFIVAFDNKVSLLSDFSSDAVALENSITNLKPGGNTALYDALIFASEKLRQRPEKIPTRRVLVVISDGIDTVNRSIMNDAQQAATHAEAVIFALSDNDLSMGYPKGEAVLELLTRATGGGVLRAKQEYDLKRAFEQIEQTLRSQYALGYTPANFQPDGTFHSVELLSRKSGLQVRCHKGYFASTK